MAIASAKAGRWMLKSIAALLQGGVRSEKRTCGREGEGEGEGGGVGGRLQGREGLPSEVAYQEVQDSSALTPVG